MEENPDVPRSSFFYENNIRLQPLAVQDPRDGIDINFCKSQCICSIKDNNGASFVADGGECWKKNSDTDFGNCWNGFVGNKYKNYWNTCRYDPLQADATNTCLDSKYYQTS